MTGGRATETTSHATATIAVVSGDPTTTWSFEPGILIATACYVGIYVWRYRHARRESRGRGVGPQHLVFFGVAILALLAGLITPLAALGEERLFSMHMFQHVLLADIAPLFLLLSLSRVMMRPATRRLVAIERKLGRLAHPATFFVAWLALIYVWHYPPLYEAAIENDVVHALEHAVFFAAGLLFWWPLIQPVPMRHRLTRLQPFAYLVLGKVLLGLFGVYLTWTDHVLYPYYETVPRTWGLSPIADQNVGGAIMMAEQSIVLACAFVVLFARMLTQSEQEQERRERLEELRAT